jgi:Methyltransferase domain
MSSHPNDPWKKHSRHWSSVGQPLRPGAEDIAFTCGAISEWFHSNNGTAPTLLVMGVTPELCSLPTNSGSRFIAVDKSAEMIGNLWHPRPGAQDQAVCADWRQMSLAPATVDIALGDGSLSTLEYPSEYITVFGELRRVLRPGSRCVIRCFMQTDTPETTDEVFADLSQTRIGSFHVLKWRLIRPSSPGRALLLAYRAGSHRCRLPGRQNPVHLSYAHPILRVFHRCWILRGSSCNPKL